MTKFDCEVKIKSMQEDEELTMRQSIQEWTK